MSFFFFNDTATTEIYTLSLHDALPIFFTVALVTQHEGVVVVLGVLLDEAAHLAVDLLVHHRLFAGEVAVQVRHLRPQDRKSTSSELQSRQYLVCRLLLEKKKNTIFISN